MFYSSYLFSILQIEDFGHYCTLLQLKFQIVESRWNKKNNFVDHYLFSMWARLPVVKFDWVWLNVGYEGRHILRRVVLFPFMYIIPWERNTFKICTVRSDEFKKFKIERSGTYCMYDIVYGVY